MLGAMFFQSPQSNHRLVSLPTSVSVSLPLERERGKWVAPLDQDVLFER